MTSTRWAVLPAAVAVLAAAACGGGNSSSSSGSSATSTPTSTPASSGSGTSSGGGGRTLSLAADPSGKLMFDKKTLTAKAGKVTIKFANSSGIPHAVAVEGNGIDKDGQTISQGSNTLTVDLKPGSYAFYCPVDGHRQAGMEGKLTVK